MASLLAEHRVPVAVLNACQSAMQSDSEAGLAQQLAEAGVPVAVGMAYSVTVSAAERAMPVLYRRVAEGRDLVAAVHAARRDLHEHGPAGLLRAGAGPGGLGAAGRCSASSRCGLRCGRWRTLSRPRFYQRQAVVGDEPATEYGFVGRDLDIQAIEQRLLAGPDGNQLLVQGMAGAGKSTLLAHLAWWWQRTGLVDRVFRFSYEDRAWTAGQIIREIRVRLLSPAEHARADSMSEAAQAEQVAGLLRAARHLLILDNAESITAAPAAIPHALDAGEQDQLRALLARLRGGRTLVLLGSRESRGPGSPPGSFGPGTSTRCPAWTPQAASLLVDRILGRHGATRWLDDDAERQRAAGPGHAAGRVPAADDRRPAGPGRRAAITGPGRAAGGRHGADPAGLISRAIEYSHGKLDPALQDSLLLLAPFTAVIPAGPVLDHYQDLLCQTTPSRRWATVDLAAALDQAVRVGLAAPHPQLSYWCRSSRCCPTSCAAACTTSPPSRAATSQAHYQLYAKLWPAHCTQMLTSPGDPAAARHRAGRHPRRVRQPDRRLAHGLRTGQPIRRLVAAAG